MGRIIETARLQLREWREEDLDLFARMNADDRVMEYFPNKLSPEGTLAFYNRIQDEFARCGYGLYAVELKSSGSFIGFVGLHNVTAEVDFAPAVEIGWRLCFEAWGQGYATEAASACLKYAATNLPLKEVVSFTSLTNKRSQRVMQKIGMEFVMEFDHPAIPLVCPLCRHVLYKIELSTI